MRGFPPSGVGHGGIGSNSVGPDGTSGEDQQVNPRISSVNRRVPPRSIDACQPCERLVVLGWGMLKPPFWGGRRRPARTWCDVTRCTLILEERCRIVSFGSHIRSPLWPHW